MNAGTLSLSGGNAIANTGALVLASDQLEFYDNDIKDNNTVGMVVVNYGLADPSQSQLRYDFFPEGTHIYGNTFTNNGSNPQLPDPERSTCTGPNGLPGPGDDPQCLGDNAGLLVTIIQLKNGGKSAQIIWDGATDTANDCDTIPVDSDGIPLSQPNPNETRAQRYEARMDERGRPNLYQYDPEPACKYNAWKFDDSGALKKPQNGMCIENNTFNKTTPQALLVAARQHVIPAIALAEPRHELDPVGLVLAAAVFTVLKIWTLCTSPSSAGVVASFVVTVYASSTSWKVTGEPIP